MTTKDRVLARLLRTEEHLSGEALSRELGISRAAVHAAVQKLREEGFRISSATNRGYRLEPVPDLFSAASLLSLLGEERMRRVLFYDTTDSTNRRLQEAALDPSAPSGLTAVADRQTEGRGRRGRSFYSPSGSGIYLSMLVRPAGTAQHTDPGVWTSVTARVSVAVCDAVEAVCRIRPGIKWVNDLLAGGRKVCGILTQMDMESETGDIRDIIVGIGINVQGTAEDLPEELRGTAGFLSQSADRPVPRAALAAEIIRRLDALFAVWPDGHAAALEQYRKDSLVIGREIRVITGTSERKAIAEAVGDDFALHVRYEDGTREALRGGEITLRLT